MSTETDFNTAPIWDDYDPKNNYHRVLFRPSVPVQARELTQLQTIQQAQIERFGEHMFKDGTIVKGCSFTFDPQYFYVKILDNQVDGQPINTSMFANTVLTNSANIQATVVNFEPGLESQNPDLNTLYIKYLNTGTDGSRNFQPGETLSSYYQNRRLSSGLVANSGAGYSNNDTVVFASNTGSGAAARLVTDGAGRIQDMIFTSYGKDYYSDPIVSIANTTGGTANGVGGILSATSLIAQVTVAGNTFVTANTQEYQTVGTGYAMRVSEGIIFQKGFFINVNPQTAIVSKYTTQPDLKVAGFRTVESVVNNSVDPSLLDNAQGEPNYNAPGAYRLKLTPEITILDRDVAEQSNTFFTLVSFEEGRVVQTRSGAEYNALGKELARRTSEESGNYVVKPFTMYTDEIRANTSHLQLRTSSGLAYVGGYRVEQLDTSSIPMRKGTDVKEVDNVTISTNYGNYLYVSNLKGLFPIHTAAEVSLYSAVSTGVSSAAGTLLGKARVRAIVHDTGVPGTASARYRLYLFNIKMSSGASFANTKSVFYSGSTTPDNAVADVVLENGKAVLQEPSYATSVFPLGRKAIKTIRNTSNGNDTSFTYITLDNGVSFNTAGTLQKNLTGNDRFPYNGTLNDVEERDIIFVSRNSANSATAGTGTVNVAAGNTTVTGTSTNFLTYYLPGDYVAFGGGAVGQIRSIANNTNMTLEAAVGAVSGATHVKHFPAYTPIAFTNRPARTITISGGQQAMTASIGHGLSNVLNVNAVYNIQRSTALQLTKNFVPEVYVKIATGTTLKNKQWCLGIPDAHRLVSVTRSANSDYTTGAVDVTKEFTLLDGQMDTHYGLAALQKKPTSKLTVGNNEYYLIKFSAFTNTNTGGGAGFFTIDSYPVDDTANAVPTTIKTENIPVFVSPTTGGSIDLRDAVDFRPVVANTAVVATSPSAATINPSAVESFSTDSKFFATPNKNFICDLQHYVGRYDKLVVASTGQFSIVEGTASDHPYPPQDQDGAMTLATVAIPPYPTLSTKSGNAVKRPDYTVKVSTSQTRRYTMADIGKMDNRVQRLEYYTALSLLEKQAADMNIPSTVDGLDRFKNGIFVDPFSDFSVGNVVDGEFTAGIDEAAGELIPRFEQTKFDLQIANTAGVINSAGIVTLPYTHKAFMSQPYANRVRNCVENFWSFKGKLMVTPSYDNYYEVRKAPQNNMSINIDNASAALAVIDELNNIRAVNQPVISSTTSSSTQLVGSTTSANSSGTSVTETYETVQTTTTTQAHTILTGSTRETTEVVGDFVTDVSFSPFMREQPLHFRAYGMKPNSIVFAFFDKVNVSSRVRPARFNASRSPTGDNPAAWEPYGRVGDPLVVNARGEVFGIFYLPASTFFVGDRELRLLDVNSMSSQSAASTSAAVTFHGYNYSVSTSSLSVSTRSLEVDTSTSTSTSTTTTRSTEDRSTFTPNPPVVPEPPVIPPVVPDQGSYIELFGPGAGASRVVRYTTNQAVLDYLVSNNGGGNRISSAVAYGVGQWELFDGTNYTGNRTVVDPANPQFHIGSINAIGRIRSLRRVGSGGGSTGGGGGGGGGGPITGGGNIVRDVWDISDALQMAVAYDDPIAQTFRVSAESAAGQEGLFVTKLDLYFQRKDPVMGVTVELRLTENGYPSASVLPLGRKHLTSSEVKVSENASQVTTVEFDAPIFLKSSQEYAFVVIPDGNSPEYLIWTGVVGESDIQNSAITIRSDWGSGVMFTSTNNSAWTSYQDEDIKFRLHRADFTQTTGNLTLTNKSDEFLTGSAATGIFTHGETVFKYTSPIVGDVSFDTNSSIVTGVGTTFLTTFSPGQKIVLSNTPDISVGAAFDVVEIASIQSQTQLTVHGTPKFGARSVKALATVTGNVYLYEADKMRMHLSDSTATAGNFLQAGDVIVGDINGATLTIGSVDNQVVSYMQPLIYRTSVIGTGIAASMQMIDPSYINRGVLPIKFNDTNYLNAYEAVVASRSNEIAFMNGQKSFRLPVTLTSNSKVVSPTLDMQACSILRYKNLINDTLVGEASGQGDAISKYVSKTIVLADGQDSEDLKAYITAYKPVGTEIDVYARVMSASDSEFLRDKTWTKLERVGAQVYCDSADRNDFREFEYTFPTAPETVAVSGTATFNNSAIVTAVGSNFTSTLEVGDVVKLINGANYDVAKVISVNANDSITLSKVITWVASGGSIEKFTNPEEAFRNPSGLNAVSYFSEDSMFETFKTFAIKIVLRAATTNRVPRLRDVRALAMTM